MVEELVVKSKLYWSRNIPSESEMRRRRGGGGSVFYVSFASSLFCLRLSVFVCSDVYPVWKHGDGLWSCRVLPYLCLLSLSGLSSVLPGSSLFFSLVIIPKKKKVFPLIFFCPTAKLSWSNHDVFGIFWFFGFFVWWLVWNFLGNREKGHFWPMKRVQNRCYLLVRNDLVLLAPARFLT